MPPVAPYGGGVPNPGGGGGGMFGGGGGGMELTVKVCPVRSPRAPELWAHQGRTRRLGIGLDHHRPPKRHREGGAGAAAMTARGHATSMAAAMATASSSVGVGEMSIGAAT